MKLTYKDILTLMYKRNDYKVTGIFGEKKWPRTKAHDGTDFAIPSGTQIYFPEDAIVTAENWGVSIGSVNPFGHDFGNWTMFYVPKWDRTYLVAHTLYKGSVVDKGKSYTKGQRITKSGNTGLTVGPHVHKGVAKGKHTTLASLRANAIDFITDVIVIDDEIAPGSKIKIKATATKYATGQTMPKFVKGTNYTVAQVSKDKSQVLVKEIMSWVYAKDVDLL